MLNFFAKVAPSMLINVMLIKKTCTHYYFVTLVNQDRTEASPEAEVERDDCRRSKRDRKPTSKLTYFEPGGDPIAVPVDEGQEDTEVSVIQRVDAADKPTKPIPKPRPNLKAPMVTGTEKDTTSILRSVFRKLSSLLETIESG